MGQPVPDDDDSRVFENASNALEMALETRFLILFMAGFDRDLVVAQNRIFAAVATDGGSTMVFLSSGR